MRRPPPPAAAGDRERGEQHGRERRRLGSRARLGCGQETVLYSSVVVVADDLARIVDPERSGSVSRQRVADGGEDTGVVEEPDIRPVQGKIGRVGDTAIVIANHLACIVDPADRASQGRRRGGIVYRCEDPARIKETAGAVLPDDLPRVVDPGKLVTREVGVGTGAVEESGIRCRLGAGADHLARIVDPGGGATEVGERSRRVDEPVVCPERRTRRIGDSIVIEADDLAPVIDAGGLGSPVARGSLKVDTVPAVSTNDTVLR